MKKKIIIIGGGNIGSRHMQAFASSDIPLQLYILDPSNTSLNICIARWEEVNGNENKYVEIFFLNDYQDVPNNIDLAIISTNAQHRFRAIKKLTEVSEIKYLILEKFLFNGLEEYTMTNKIIKQRNITTFVNCARRQYKSYLFIKELLSKQNGILLVTISGNNWGMGSNAIHFLDLFCFLTEETLDSCHYADLQNTYIVKSKREGYVELFGTLYASTVKGNRLKLSCFNDNFSEISIELQKNDLKITVIEKGSECLVKINNHTPIIFSIPYQSQLTYKSFEVLQKGEKISLTPYENSVLPHLKFLEAVNEVAIYKGYSDEWKIT